MQTPHNPTSALLSSRYQDEQIKTSAPPPPGSVWCMKISPSLKNHVMTQHRHSRTAEKIEDARGEGRTAFIGYLSAGLPRIDESIEEAVDLWNNGANVIEIRLPNSDPFMDGEVIQRASSQA